MLAGLRIPSWSMLPSVLLLFLRVAPLFTSPAFFLKPRVCGDLSVTQRCENTKGWALSARHSVNLFQFC